MPYIYTFSKLKRHCRITSVREGCIEFVFSCLYFVFFLNSSGFAPPCAPTFVHFFCFVSPLFLFWGMSLFDCRCCPRLPLWICLCHKDRHSSHLYSSRMFIGFFMCHLRSMWPLAPIAPWAFLVFVKKLAAYSCRRLLWRVSNFVLGCSLTVCSRC